MYSRSVSGKVAPRSTKAIAPKNAIMPPTNQGVIINKGFRYECSKSKIVMKIASPIIIAAIILVQWKAQSLLSNFWSEKLN